jgi:flagellar hook-associated protein 2
MINFGGLATGLDTQALISGLMLAESIPLQRLERRQSDLEGAKSKLSDILGTFSAVSTAADDLSDAKGFGSYAASSSSEALVATASNPLAEGSYQITVNQLAKAHRSMSDGVADNVTALGETGTLELTVGTDAQIDVALDAGDSIVDIAQKINDSGARVTASVVFDGTDHHLVVRGTDTGAANAVTFGGNDLGLGAAPNQLTAAQDASIDFDGMTITRDSNQIDGVIDGVSFAVTEASGQPINVTVARDGQALKDKITAFVEAYNEAVATTQSATGYGSLTAQFEALAGDSALRNATTLMSTTISSPIAGLTGKYDLLASVGVHLDRNGKLELDESKLDEALADDVQAVERVFVGDPDNNIDGAMANIMGVIDRIADDDDATLQLRVDAMGDQITRMDDDVLRLERRLEDYEANLVKKFTALEILVSQIQAQESALAGLSNFSYNNNNG